MAFVDRAEAGRRLAQRLEPFRGTDPVVAGVAPAGVPIALQVALLLRAPLDVVVAPKPAVPLAGRTVIVVDDGIDTGSTARAACAFVRARGADRVVLAVPVAPPGWEHRLAGAADDFVCVETPPAFRTVRECYEDFPPVSEDDVAACLRTAKHRAGWDEEVEVGAGRARLGGRLTVPGAAAGVVLFAHGSGSGRHSPRNRYVAGVLNGAGVGTLLFDLLTTGEEQVRANVFDVALLADRLVGATRWLPEAMGGPPLPIGYFGASTGAAAALWAAAEPGADIAAVVSRGGRPDLAASRLGAVRAPTLLVVGGRDQAVLELNRAAQRRLAGETRLAVVPGATHLFEEPGTLEAVAQLAADWFMRHLAARRPADHGPRDG